MTKPYRQAKSRKRKAKIVEPPRPLFTRQEYRTIIDALSTVKMIGEKSESFVERRGASSIIPNSNYHVALIDKIAANTEGLES